MNPDRINIALLVRNFGLGGAERQTLELAKRLDRRKHNIFLITMRDGGELRTSFLSLPGLHIVVLGVTNPLGAFFKLAHVLEEAQIHILQSFLLATNVYSLLVKLLKPRVKVLIGIRDSQPDFCFGYSSLGWKLKMRALELCMTCFSRVADLCIANSESGKAAYERKFGIRSVVIPNGIDSDMFKPDDAAWRSLRELVGVSAEAKLIGVVANVTPPKDYPTFVRAAKRIVDKGYDVHFLSFGDTRLAEGERVVQLVRELGLNSRFHFLGLREDVHKLLPGLDVLCSSSITEGFSNSIAEAMACGVPCVVTDAGDSRRIVGDRGIVVPLADSAALSAGLSVLLSMKDTDLRTLSAAVRQRIVLNFDAAVMAAQYEQLYDLVLAKTSREPDLVRISG